MSVPSMKPKNMAMRGLEYARAIGGILRDGLSFKGNRDVYTVFGYKDQITYFDMLAKYHRQDIASRIVDSPANAVWTNPPDIKGGSGKLTVAITDLAQRLSLWNVLNRADKLSGMGRYATILMGVDDGKELGIPLRPNPKNKVIFMQPYSIDAMKVVEFETDAGSPRFGKPLFYSLNPAKTGVNGAEQPLGGSVFAGFRNATSRIHWSRVLHIVENPLENDSFGVPRMMQAYNLLEDILKVAGGSAEIYWLNARGGLHIDVDKELDLSEPALDTLADEVEDYSNNLQRVMRTRGVNVKPIEMAVADPSATFTVSIALLSATSKIPQRVLLGAEAGQLASAQDRANWASAVEERREFYAEACVLRAVFFFLERLGQIQEVDYLGATVTWPEAFKMNPLERAQTSAQQARSVANLIKGLGTPATPATADTTDSATGIVTPGTPGDPGIPALVSIDEARGIIASGNPEPFKQAASSLSQGVG